MEDLKKKINFDPSLLYYSPNNKESKDDEKPSVTNVETYNSTNRKHVCTVCGKRFFSVSALNLHMEHHPPSERPSIEKDNDNANLNRKNQYVWNKGSKCNKSECNFIALDAVEYSKHISSCEGKRVTQGGENISFCELCDSYFSSENHFKAHLILQHPDCDPDISLKEYDAKHTTISDPVSLYVSENNLEEDSEVKQSKGGHSKYPDSFISKKKSKEADSEEATPKQDTSTTGEKVTAAAANESVMEKAENVIHSNYPSVDVNVELENSSAEIATPLNNTELVIPNESSADVEKEKIDEIPETLETSVSEKIDDVQNQSDFQSENTQKLNDQVVTQEKTQIEEIFIDFELETKDEKKTVLENSTTNVSNEEKSNETSIIEQEIIAEKKDNTVDQTVDDDVVTNDKTDVESSEKNISDDTTKSSLKADGTDDVQESEDRSKNESKSEAGKQESKETERQEHYMNVEKMMYNLFNDEKTTAKAEENASSQRDETSQALKEEAKQKQVIESNKEFDDLLNETSTKTPKPEDDNLETQKDDSDFEEFDYSRAGKKKYLKSYGRRSKKSKIDLDETEISNIVETPEKTDEIDESLISDVKPIKKGSVKGNSPKSSLQKRIKQDSHQDTNKPTTELNIKERSTRTRKKLILPEYEYDSDYKSYCNSETSSKRTESVKPPSANLQQGDHSTPRKRGRPRKNVDVSMSGIDANESIISTDVSSSTINKSTANVKEKIESSYLNTSEASAQGFAPNDTIQSIDVQEFSACSQLSQNESLEKEEDSSKSEIKPEEQTDSTDVVKKKRGRPRKIKREVKRVQKPESSSLSTPDKSAEESIFSDLANALLSLGGSITDKPQESVKPQSTSTAPQKSNVIIKRKKLKPTTSAVKNKIEKSNEPTFEMKNDIENEIAESSSEVDDDLSFNDANKFEKEKSSGPQSSFMKDISLTTNVSTPKKRGRPPKVSKTENHSTTGGEISPATQPKPKSQKLSRLETENRANKLFKSKLADRKSVFLKKKLIKHKKIKSHLDAVSFSLLQNNSAIKKRGRPPKISKEKAEERKNAEEISKTDEATIESHSENEEHEEVVHYIQNLKDESLGDVSNISVPIDDSKIKESCLPKKKKGRPPKDKNASASGSGLKKKTSAKSSATEKDLNLNDLKSSHKGRENSPFIYESYHPKKKRPRIDSKTDDIVDVKTNDYVPKKVARIPKSPPHEPKDETYAVNKDLYLEDMKARAKYGKLFKKPKNFVYNEKFTDDMMVTCGRCENQMTFRHYKNCHQISHYYICWIQGESEININDDAEVIRILQAAITPESLRKKAIRLACEKCGDVRKSVVGYVSHVRFCQKEDKNNLFETCTLCGRVLRPSSVRFHYIKFHGTSKPKDGSFNSSQNNTLENSQDGQDDSDDARTETPYVKRYRMGFTKKFLQKKDIINDEQFWTNLKTSYDLYMCMGLSCKHMTLSKDDLKSHILHCSANFCEFSCSSCPYKTKYENEIIYHSKKKCQDDTDDEQSKEEVSEIAERRVSTRKRKRKFKYDSPNELNETSEEEKNVDHDFEDELISDDDEYFSESESMSRRSRSKRKKTDRPIGFVSDKLGLRNAFQQYCLGRTDPLRWTVDLRLKLFSSTPLHVHMKVNTKEWETVSSTEVDKYIPVHQKSVRVYFDSAPPSQFNLFQADVLKGIPTCFVGGPVWAMAWAPLPAQVTEQILAVSTLQHMNHVVEMNNSLTFPSLIQFWRFNSIDNISNDIQKPALAWSIAHNYGAIWSMEWCPSGGFNNLSNTCRLGILAAATSAGCVIIYNIPKLEINEISGEYKDIVTNPKADLLLKVRNENVQCTRIVWDQTSPHNTVIGGFSDGSVAFWNINTASVLLKKGSVIYPYRTFEAHNTPITALDLHWLSNSRFLLTGSTDRVTRYWDLNDLSGPMYEYERTTAAMNATWMQHWIVTANVHDFGTLIGDAGAFIAHPRDAVEKRRTIVSVRDAFWSVSYSLWNDMVAVSSNGGFVTAYAAKQLSSLTYKQPEFEKVVTWNELVDLSEEEKKDLDVDKIISTMPTVDNSLDCTKTIKNNGIRFSEKTKSKETSETAGFNMQSPLSVNKVCWNPNYNSFNWLAIGYECGFVRVVRVERFDKHYLTKFYKTNENTATLM